MCWRLCRGIVGRIIVACAVIVAVPADRAEAQAQASADVPALPATLTRESVRDLLTRLSDVQVRDLLIDQLDRSVAPATKPQVENSMAAMAGMAGMVDQHAGTMRSRYDTLYDALVALPATLRGVANKLIGVDARSETWPLLAYLAALLATGALAESLYVYALRRYRERLRYAPAATFSARAFQLGAGLLLDLGGIAAFGVAAIVFFFALWLEHELRRILVLEVLFAVVVVRTAATLARSLLAPAGRGNRLLPFAEIAPIRDRACGDLRRELCHELRAGRGRCESRNRRSRRYRLLDRGPVAHAVDRMARAQPDRGPDPRQR